jgi:hypothetical protein
MAVVLQKINKYFYDYKCVVITLSEQDIQNGKVELPVSPNTSLPISLYPAGGPRQILGEAYGIQGPFVVFSGFGFDGVLVANDVIEVCYFTNDLISAAFDYKCVVFTITQEDLDNKRIKLDNMPNMDMPFQLYPAGGTKQILGDAFDVEEDYIIFDGLGFDGVLRINDRIEVCYFTKN